MRSSDSDAMKEKTDRNVRAVAKASRELAQLRAQAEQARATLARLRQDVAEGGTRRAPAAQLVEANEQLVVASLRAQTDAEAAALALKEVSRSAELDGLTQLPNRALMLDRLARAIAHAKRHSGRLALLFLDIDNFKQINDTLGHAAGDQVLKLAAHSLVSSIRAVDTVSRHGGDEFLILLTELSQRSDVVVIAEKVIAALAATNRICDHAVRLTASIGVTIYPADGEDADVLIDRADAAMYRAKRAGLGGFVFHSEEAANEGDVGAYPLDSRQQPSVDHGMAGVGPERRRGQRDRRSGNWYWTP